MESGVSSSSFSIDNILKPDKCDSSQEPRSADRALTLAERLAGKYCLVLIYYVVYSCCYLRDSVNKHIPHTHTLDHTLSENVFATI